MKIYLMAKYERFPEMQKIAALLEQDGHEVTSRWIRGLSRPFDPDMPEAMKNTLAAKLAQQDLDDLREADVCVGFSDDPTIPGRGGRHVEMGYALALGKKVWIVGGMENIFHCLPQVALAGDLEELRDVLQDTTP